MIRGFGLDLAGYSTGKSELAMAELGSDQVRVVLLRRNIFSKKRKSNLRNDSVGQEEAAVLDQLLAWGPVAVDVPIDLQGLPTSPASEELWGQTRRPIDFALGALAPCADRLGSVVSRFQNILRFAQASTQLGIRLFETYPAASLVCLGTLGKGYKGKTADEQRRTIASFLGLECEDLSDDELDAVICALTAVAPSQHVLEGRSLANYIARKKLLPNFEPPVGYRLLRTPIADKIVVSHQEYSAWKAENR